MWGNRARASRGFRVAALDFPYLGRGGKQNWITAAAVRSPPDRRAMQVRQRSDQQRIAQPSSSIHSSAYSRLAMTARLKLTSGLRLRANALNPAFPGLSGDFERPFSRF